MRAKARSVCDAVPVGIKLKKVIRLGKGASLLINECCMKLTPQNYVAVPGNSTSILPVINARLTSLEVKCCIGVK